MRTIPIKQFLDELKAQGAENGAEAVFLCPLCGTPQNSIDLIAAGAGPDFAAVQKYIGFSCVGRWTHQKEPPRKPGKQVGCNWTLGGLFKLHKLTVVDDEGKERPHFELASPETAKQHVKNQKAKLEKRAGKTAGSGAGEGV
jgi:hypothetical protein